MLKKILLVSVLVALVPCTQAASTVLTSPVGAGACQKIYSADNLAVALGVAAGTTLARFEFPCDGIVYEQGGSVVGAYVPFVWNLDGPSILAGGLAGTTAVYSYTVGGDCQKASLEVPPIPDSTVNDFSTLTSHSIFSFTVHQTGPVCRVESSVTLTLATVITLHFRSETFMYMLPTHQFNINCAATGAVPAPYDPYTTACTTPTTNTVISGTLTATLAGTLALTGTLGLSQDGGWTFTLNGIPDTQQEIQAIANALTTGVDVRICPLGSPCYHIVDLSDDTTPDGAITVLPEPSVSVGETTVVVNGTTVQVNGTQAPDHIFICAPTGQLDNETTCDPPEKGWNGSLYLFILLFGLVLAMRGESSKDRLLRGIGGFVIMLAGFILYWPSESQRMGFQNVSSEFLLPFVALHFGVGLYLILSPKKEN